jgi:hypothetical protein
MASWGLKKLAGWTRSWRRPDGRWDSVRRPVDLRATTFALAVDLVLADGRLGTRESTFIDQLQAALRIEYALGRKILDVLLIKNRASGRPDV